MNSKTLFVYNSSTLFEILVEIKEILSFEVVPIENKELDKSNLSKYENFLIVSDSKNDIENCKILSVPKKIDKILEQINIWFLSNKYSSQAKVKIGNYFLNLNSRQIINNNNSLNLTEKETELILFVLENKNVSLKDLQKNVWKHTSELETHTVETHVYRLRKKIFDKFQDENFINHGKQGYYLN